MASYSLDPNREMTHIVVDNFDAVGREGVYAGSYEDCQAFIAEQPDSCMMGMYDIVPNWRNQKNENKHNIEDWWSHNSLGDRQEASGILLENYQNEPVYLEATDEWWESLSEEQKLDVYRKIVYGE